MKKILILLSLTLCFMVSCNDTKAQLALMYNNADSTTTGAISSVTTKTIDTLYDANTIYTLYTKAGYLGSSASSKYLFTFDVTKITGTGTASVYVQVSNDGVTWRNVNARMLGTDGLNSDTLTIAAASTTTLNYSYYSIAGQGVYRPSINTGTFWVPAGRAFYARLKIVGAGTQATAYSNGKVYTIN